MNAEFFFGNYCLLTQSHLYITDTDRKEVLKQEHRLQ